MRLLISMRRSEVHGLEIVSSLGDGPRPGKTPREISFAVRPLLKNMHMLSCCQAVRKGARAPSEPNRQNIYMQRHLKAVDRWSSKNARVLMRIFPSKAPFEKPQSRRFGREIRVHARLLSKIHPIFHSPKSRSFYVLRITVLRPCRTLKFFFIKTAEKGICEDEY